MYLAKHLFIWYRLCLRASGILSAIDSDLFTGGDVVLVDMVEYN